MFSSIDWSYLAKLESVETMVDSFYEKFIVYLTLPKTKSSKARYPVWFDKHVISLIKQKEYYRLRCRKDSTVENLYAYSKLRRIRYTCKMLNVT